MLNEKRSSLWFRVLCKVKKLHVFMQLLSELRDQLKNRYIMWCSRSVILVFIYCSIGVVLATHDCDQQVEDFNWEPKDDPLPAVIYEDRPRNRNANKFRFVITNVTENLTVTAYVNPYINSTDCPERPLTTRDLYRHWHPTFIPNGTEIEWFLANAPSGCYYVQMTNATGHNFLGRIPNFVNKSIHFYDWNLKCMNPEFIPANTKANAQFRLTLEIPLKCLQIKVQLFELSDSMNCSETEHYSGPGKAPLIGACSFTKKTESCKSPFDGIGFNIRRNLSTDNEKWWADITWSNLRKGCAHYYSNFSIMSGTCNMSYADVMTWQPAYILRSIYHGKRDGDNIPVEVPTPSRAMVELIVWITLGLILTVISIYWIKKCIRILIKPKKPSNVLPAKGPAEVAPSDSDILLMYVSSSSDLLKTIGSYRRLLQKKCHCQVHDIYSKNELTEVAKLGATMWVEKMLKADSKVIWFDTPEFRSALNYNNSNKEKENGTNWRDHRFAAIPYALNLTKHLFQDVTTQYRHHFVVRLEGLDVTNENEDPLSVISPGVRYCLPRNFDALCVDLNNKTLKNL